MYYVGRTTEEHRGGVSEAKQRKDETKKQSVKNNWTIKKQHESEAEEEGNERVKEESS